MIHARTISERGSINPILPRRIALLNAYEQNGTAPISVQTPARRRSPDRRWIPALFYGALCILNLLFLVVFGGTSFRSDLANLYSRITPPSEAAASSAPLPEVEPLQFPPGENYSGQSAEDYRQQQVATSRKGDRVDVE